MLPSQILRERTAKAHTALEQLPFGRRLPAGNIDSTTYLDYLRAIFVLVASLRTDISRHGSELQQHFLTTLEDWAQRLEADIRSLSEDDGLANGEAQDAATRLVQKMRCHLMDDPHWIAGLAYVLYGSHHGNRSIAPAVARALSLPEGVGTSYLLATRHNGSDWSRFKDLLDRTLVETSRVDAAVQGALDTFECFGKVFEALDNGAGRETRASALNPEAGDHPVVVDPDLLRIATYAGTMCHTGFGYLVLRFGERGEAFARSDGAWLPIVCDLPREQGQERMNWLARLLSARTIPTVCLEYHLEVLHRELANCELMAPDSHQRLREYMLDLRARSRSVIDGGAYRELVARPLPALDPRGAELLLSAAIDQKTGLAPCADRIGQWIETTDLIDKEQRRELLDFLKTAQAACT